MMHSLLYVLYFCCRDSLGGQLQLAMAKADSEQLARTIAEEQLSDVEKEKTMLELEIKEILSRHKSELVKKDSVISMVSSVVLCPWSNIGFYSAKSIKV